MKYKNYYTKEELTIKEIKQKFKEFCELPEVASVKEEFDIFINENNEYRFSVKHWVEEGWKRLTN